MIRKFRKKPVIIEAVQWNGKNTDEILEFIGETNGHLQKFESGTKLFMIYTLEGTHEGKIGDWIIKGIQGEFYPCKPDIFEATYEIVG